jgi:hypothetical protein
MNLRVAFVLSVMTLAAVAALFPALPVETVPMAGTQDLRDGRGLVAVSTGSQPDPAVLQPGLAAQ